jgi:hypothetical protein
VLLEEDEADEEGEDRRLINVGENCKFVSLLRLLILPVVDFVTYFY